MSYAENLELIQLFKGLRVTDVRDGMDTMGYHHYGSVAPCFRPLYRGAAATGIARTARFIPYEGPTPHVAPEEYWDWVKTYYAEVNPDPWEADLQPGDFACLDAAECDVGNFGSYNTLKQKRNGCVGGLINGGARDTDEIIQQRIPIWSKFISHNMCQARMRYIDKDIPIGIGGVAIYPGDVVVGDGDGVIVVPRKIARDVAKWARREADSDRIGRQRYYKALGLPLDDTVMPIADGQ